jgi:hypothetical protein
MNTVVILKRRTAHKASKKRRIITPEKYGNLSRKDIEIAKSFLRQLYPDSIRPHYAS